MAFESGVPGPGVGAVLSAVPPRATRRARDARVDAKGICLGCPVQRECLEFALRVHEPHGIWGGLTESERRHLLPIDESSGIAATDVLVILPTKCVGQLTRRAPRKLPLWRQCETRQQ